MSDELQARIHVDAAICGGRPHLRGTRVRVSDILDLLASGVLRPRSGGYPSLIAGSMACTTD